MTENVGLKMLHDQVLIKLGNEEENTSGIYLPDSAKKKPTEGLVCAVGPGAPCGSTGMLGSGKVTPLTVKEGDKVIYRKWAGNEIKHNGLEYIVLKESDIIAIVEGE